MRSLARARHRIAPAPRPESITPTYGVRAKRLRVAGFGRCDELRCEHASAHYCSGSLQACPRQGPVESGTGPTMRADPAHLRLRTRRRGHPDGRCWIQMAEPAATVRHQMACSEATHPDSALSHRCNVTAECPSSLSARRQKVARAHRRSAAADTVGSRVLPARNRRWSSR